MTKFVPLDSINNLKYMHNRREVFNIAKKILKSWGYNGLDLEDTNKISFKTCELTFQELTHLKCKFEEEMYDDVRNIWIEADEKAKGIWLTFVFDNMNLFPLSKKTPKRLKD